MSVFLLVALTLAGAAAAAASNSHIATEFFITHASPGRRHLLVALSALSVAVLFVLMAWLFARAAFDEYQFGETTPGIGVPRWWYTMWFPPLALLVAWRAVRAWRHGIKASASGAEGERA